MEQQTKTVMHNGTKIRNSLLSCTKGSWQLVPAPAKLHQLLKLTNYLRISYDNYNLTIANIIILIWDVRCDTGQTALFVCPGGKNPWMVQSHIAYVHN